MAIDYAKDTGPYERFKFDIDFRNVIRCFPGEHILSLHPFGWHLDGHRIPNCPEQYRYEDALAVTHMLPVQSYGDFIHVVREP